MIDTVVLTIPKSQLKRFKTEKEWDLFAKTQNYEKFVKNPSKANIETWLYFPRFLWYKRYWLINQEAVRMEFSVPKILYLNNLEELTVKDFDKVIDTLVERISMMGMLIERDSIINASVSAVHYSKNIVLEDWYTASYVISELHKVNMRKSFDYTKARYMNDGQSLVAHATSHEMIIYDKVSDMLKWEKRAIDKDQTAYQMLLFEDIPKKELLEILRFEIRLWNKTKINSLFTSLGYSKNPTFRDVFNLEVSKRVVRKYWEEYMKWVSIWVLSTYSSPKDLLRNFLYNSKTPKEAIYLTWLILLSRDGDGIRELRSIIEKNAVDRTWYRLSSDLKKANIITSDIEQPRSWVNQIDKKLDSYFPINKDIAQMIIWKQLDCKEK
jgi:hypothetical protein